MEDAARKLELNVAAVKEAVHEQLDDSKRQQLLEWVCPEDTGSDEAYEAALRLKQHSTGKWFLESSIFEQWFEAKSTLLWLRGIRGLFLSLHCSCWPLLTSNTAGCGKTVLS